ncbi:MAG TPA: hypothetical protein VGP72_07225 [Planctomycetota bacterium]
MKVICLAGLLVLASFTFAEEELVPIPLELPKASFQSRLPGRFHRGLEKSRPSDQPFLVPKNVANVALKKPVTSSDEDPSFGSLALITDGDKDIEKEGHFVELGPGTQWIQIDLQESHELFAVVIWHFFKVDRAYHDVIVQIADDAIFKAGARTVYNNDADNSSGLGVGTNKEYEDDYMGKLIPVERQKARYVRCYSRGNNVNDSNQYIEVEVWGRPAK